MTAVEQLEITLRNFFFKASYGDLDAAIHDLAVTLAKNLVPYQALPEGAGLPEVGHYVGELVVIGTGTYQWNGATWVAFNQQPPPP